MDTLLIAKDLEIGKRGHIYMCAHKGVLKCYFLLATVCHRNDVVDRVEPANQAV